MNELDDLTLRIMALIERTTVADQRRQAVRDYCVRARRDKNVHEIVRLMMASRHRNDGNVIQFRRLGSSED